MKDRWYFKILKNLGMGKALRMLSFRRFKGHWPNLKNPQTWSEKLLWLNDHWLPQIKSDCADKYKVREYIKSKGYGETLVGFLGHWTDARDIDFDKLPNRFVLKCNHGCGMNILVEDKSKLNKDEAIKKLNRWMKYDQSKYANEKHYAKIKRYIICEEFLPVKHSSEIVDFKIHCFNGKIRWIGLCFDRDYETGHPQEMIMSADWERLMYLTTDREDDGKHMDKPAGLEQMKKMAMDLSKDFPYVRVDLYYVNGKIYFGELTFTPSGNLPVTEYIPELDNIAGGYLDISKIH